MPNPPLPPPEDPRELDDAALLWHDEPRTKPAARPSASRAESGESYDLTDPEPAPRRARPAPSSPDDEPPARPARRLPALLDEPSDDVVDVVYNAWAERRPAVLRLAVLLIATLALAYFSLDLGSFGVTAGILTLGLALGVFFAYPLLLTLEPPLRLTPEQAVRDYYAALEHYLPQYRRMWMLLSRGGKQSSRYASYDGFQRYWEKRLAELRGPNVSSWTPLVFEIAEFKSDKSAGVDDLSARFTVRVSARGHRAEGPIAAIPARVRLVRGPDRQWYLGDGMLPDAPPAA